MRSVWFFLFVLHLVSALDAEALAKPGEFSALEYFEARTRARPADWPTVVEFMPVQLSIPQAHDLLIGVWRMSVSCGGEPLSIDSLTRAGAEMFTGRGGLAAFVAFQYVDDGVFAMNEIMIPANAAENPAGEHRDAYVTRRAGARIFAAKDGLKIAYSQHWDSEKLEFFQIPNTGEIVLIRNRKGTTHSRFCTESKPMLFVFSKVPLS